LVVGEPEDSENQGMVVGAPENSENQGLVVGAPGNRENQRLVVGAPENTENQGLVVGAPMLDCVTRNCKTEAKLSIRGEGYTSDPNFQDFSGA
jgi:hypothetical protein